MVRKKIMLVDDTQTILMMERMILGKDYNLVLARDGMEAVEKAMGEQPDLILMDVVMPRMDGFAACQKLRQQEQTCDIPIIMVTTRAEGKNMELGFQVGCTDYVAKPINGMELLSKVRNYLGQ